MTVRILGISYGFHDAAAALLVDGVVVAAVEEERLTRRKHDPSFPGRAADVCMAIGKVDPADVDLVAFHEKPIDVLDRHLRTRMRSGPRGLRSLLFDTPETIGEQLGVPVQLHRWFRQRGADTPPIHYLEHHLSHAAAAFYPSPFEQAAVLTIDGVGEHATTTIGFGHGRHLRLDRELRFPDSVGLLYSAFTTYCGFRANSGEGELMGLAPFGEPRYAETIRREVVDVLDDGSIHLDQRCFTYTGGRRMTSRRFHDLFGEPPRPLGHPPGRREADLAASVQSVLEEIVLAMSHAAHDSYEASALCVGGGVALNCVANGRLLREGPFEHLWIQPAAGDAGSALGAALSAWHGLLGEPRVPDPADSMAGAFLGPRFERDEVRSWLEREAVTHRVVSDDDDRCALVADRLADGAVVGWFTGRLEFGPRALGHRSILADPRSSSVQAHINGLVKERAAFRPFAPAVLADKAGNWFEMATDAPYMNLTAQVSARHRTDDPVVTDAQTLEEIVAMVRSDIPAVTHVDGSARVQTVDGTRNPDFARLLRAFEARSGCPVLLNTSFNTRDEPIVCTPEDALATHRRAGLDLLVLEDCLIESEA